MSGFPAKKKRKHVYAQSAKAPTGTDHIPLNKNSGSVARWIIHDKVLVNLYNREWSAGELNPA
jgi:hypothetical protein